ncbi:MAG: glutamine--fructose-6-phosphate transaminase (isomerizing) [Candidatus Aminicenantes bacterium]|nr:glutamine--fructose-6-phosphate transaminase (isomerizing) [Candidatus Aminicenantes bacterium]
MCGIIGYVGKKDIVPILIEGLKKLEYRGYDSAGIAVLNGEDVQIRRVEGKIKILEDSLREEKLTGTYGLGHTRWATHGRPSEENAHPHQDCSHSIVVVHNGIIENYLEIKNTLRDEGHKFVSETDTEVIAHLIEKYYSNCLETAVQKAVKELVGNFAISVVSKKEKDRIITAKVGPPTVIGLGKGENFISSDLNPLLPYTQEIIFLEDGEMAVIEPDSVRFSDFEGNPLEKNAEHISWSPLMVEKQGYKHFMLKEIFEQPQVIRDTLAGRLSLDTGKVFLDEIGVSESTLQKVKRVVIIACGTSYHAGLVGKCFIETLAGIPTEVVYASEYRYEDYILEDNTLAVPVSQSGETADTLAAFKSVVEKNNPSLAICNVRNSSISRTADGVLLTHAGPEIGVAATKTFSAQMAALALLAIRLAEVRGTLTTEDSIRLMEDLQRIPHKIEEILMRAKEIEETAQQFVSYSHFLYLGRWVSFPIALEGALKLKEISYIHAEGYPGGEMKHGPIALIDEKMPTMVIIPRDRVYDKMLSNISEIKTRVGYVIAVAFEDDQRIVDKVDKIIPIPLTNPLFTPFLTTIPLQLFAYYIASIRGADVDQPRNLAKSVTVE